MPVVFGAVMPSAVVLVPEVGRGRERPAVKSIAACRRAGRLVRECDVETLVLLLPSPDERPATWLPSLTDDTLQRAFEEFEAPELSRRNRFDRDLLDAVTASSAIAWEQRRAPAIPTTAIAPLYFLDGAARLPVLPIGVPQGNLAAAEALAADLASRLNGSKRRLGVVAVGTLSTRIYPGAPGGYHPDAAAFDAAVVEALTSRNRAALRSLDEGQRTDAGERLIPQLLTLLAALPPVTFDGPPVYEAPFGEGYLTASTTPRFDQTAGTVRRRGGGDNYQ